MDSQAVNREERVWDRFLTDSDRAHLAASKQRPPFGFGERLAVVAIDNYYGGLGDEPKPLLEAIKTNPSSTGMAGWNALGQIQKLFAGAREVGVPIVHITGLSQAESGMAGWAKQRRAHGQLVGDEEAERRRWEIMPQVAPEPGEVVLKKTAPSAFFGTPLMSHLNSLGIDTLIMCGQSTSGCVRASVIDARSYRFNVIVVEECVYDRHEASHAINLFDMNQKYADVLKLDEVLAHLRGLQDQRLAG